MSTVQCGRAIEAYTGTKSLEFMYWWYWLHQQVLPSLSLEIIFYGLLHQKNMYVPCSWNITQKWTVFQSDFFQEMVRGLVRDCPCHRACSFNLGACQCLCMLVYFYVHRHFCLCVCLPLPCVYCVCVHLVYMSLSSFSTFNLYMLNSICCKLEIVSVQSVFKCCTVNFCNEINHTYSVSLYGYM